MQSHQTIFVITIYRQFQFQIQNIKSPRFSQPHSTIILMSESFEFKCRYLAQLKAFTDFQTQINSNNNFINSLSSILQKASVAFQMEIKKRSLEREKMKSPLAKQIRAELINFASLLDDNTISTTISFLQTAENQLSILHERALAILKNNNQHLLNSQSSFAFYQQKLNTSVEKVEFLSDKIRNIHKQQAIRTKELEVRGSTIDFCQRNKYQQQRQTLSTQISILERSNKRFRSDVQMEGQRLSNSYSHLTNCLVKELRRSQQIIADITSSLFKKAEPFLRPLLKEIHSLSEQINVDSQQFGNQITPIIYEQAYQTEQDNMFVPNIVPQQNSKVLINNFDSLLFSKSIVQ